MKKVKVYAFLSEIADRRLKQDKELNKQLDLLVLKFGKESKEVNDFFNQEIIIQNK